MTEKIGEVVNGYAEMVPRHVRGNEYRVLSWRNDSITAHEVDVRSLTCTCEDQALNRTGSEVCDHLAVALYAAPKRITETETAPFYLSESVERAQEAASTASEVVEDLEDAVVRTREKQAEAAHEEPEPEPTETVTERVTVSAVDDWLETGFASPELVDVRDGSHDGQDGVILEPDNGSMPDHVYESFKGLVNSLEDSTAHVGFLDEPCATCGQSDGEFWYHVPVDDGSEVWS
jgi:hypothetical protein